MSKNVTPAGSSRRDFIKAAAPLSSIAVMTRRGLASPAPPSDTFRLAFIGLGGQGTGLLRQVIDGRVKATVAAYCEVNDDRGAKGLSAAREAFPKAKRFYDYRRMFDQMHKDIDGVVIATNNHNHYHPAMAALQLRKHVFLEKPLAPTVWEVRRLMDAAAKANVTTQMGNYGHSLANMDVARNHVTSGLLGDVKEVHVWTTRRASKKIESVETAPVPESLKWDLWLGPAAWRDYSPVYLRPWQAWWDFGGGPLFDIGCHTMDCPMYALDLDAPVSIEAVEHEFISEAQPPKGSILRYEFAARGDRPPVTMYWYDAPHKPPRPPQLRDGESLEGIKFAGEGGAVFCGGKKTMVVAGMKAFGVELLPLADPGKQPSLPASGVIGQARLSHMQLWVDAAKEGKKAGADFVTSSGPLTEAVALGAIAQRMPKGTKLHWDAQKRQISNMPEANRFLKPYLRKGW